MIASLRGPLAIVELLLEAGADKDIEDMVRQSHSHMCTRLEIRKVYTIRFSRVPSPWQGGNTAEYLALVKGHMDIHTLLLDWSVLHKTEE